MKEIKFLKDLPIKLTNSNKRILTVVGGDIYYDAAGNRYGYITFNNVGKSPIFSLQLFIKEYSIEGKFIRDNEYFEPYIYYPKGSFVNNEPILLDKETEAVEITIVKVTLDKQNLIDDRYVSFKAEDYADLYQRKAPVKKPGTAVSFSFNTAPAPASRAVPEEDVEYEEGAAPAPANEEAAPALNIERETVSNEVKQFGLLQKNFWRVFYPIVGIVVLIVLIVIVTSIISGIGNSLWY